MEKTLVIIKPDAVRRKLVGEIISRYEKKGMEIIALRVLRLDENLTKTLYEEHLERDYFPPFKEFILSGPVVAIALEGEGAIQSVRKLNGATNPQDATPGTIRGDYGFFTRYNLVHGSENQARAQKEIGILFPEL
ncbi:nucleoside-diphosphate kinase [Candidatus Sumerlaeota bacterium]|nr:nucleoside-diphosphate kinase [Candidatus Sumerlaeota bacterium]